MRAGIPLFLITCENGERSLFALTNKYLTITHDFCIPLYSSLEPARNSRLAFNNVKGEFSDVTCPCVQSLGNVKAETFEKPTSKGFEF